jgi:hypothetical protein
MMHWKIRSRFGKLSACAKFCRVRVSFEQYIFKKYKMLLYKYLQIVPQGLLAYSNYFGSEQPKCNRDNGHPQYAIPNFQ